MKPGEIVKINTWRFPKARTAVVLRTYKAPDDDTLLVLPSSSPLYLAVLEAIKSETIGSIAPANVYAESKTVFSGEWMPVLQTVKL